MKAMTMMAAAALCASVFGQVTSGNVVGFQNKAVEESGSSYIVCPTFENVGESKTIRLTDIKVTGYPAGEGYQTITIQPMDGSANGKQVNMGTEEDPETYDFTFFWYDFPGYPAGWYDEDGNTLADPAANKFGICQDDITFRSGEGFIVINYDDVSTLQFAGEVKLTDTKFGFYDGSDSTVVGNPFPTPCTLDEIWVEGYAEGQGYQTITIQPMDTGANGKQVNMGTEEDPETYDLTFFWFDFPGYPAGWYDEDGNTLADPALNKFGIDEKDITFAAGDAYISIRYDDDALLCFPAPKLD